MNLSHLHPDRVRIGSIGVFAGDWAWTPTADGAMRIPAAFVGTLIDTWNGWAVFTCTRPVAEAIVADQQDQRDQYRQALVDQGVPDDDLDRQVNSSLAILTFDGDTIIADQRGVFDDPQAIERIAPDPDGRYVVMGWNWCWQAVDPADCDRIVGDLPTAGEQQQFVELTHTPGMRIPHDRLRLTVLRHWATDTGLAFTGTLALDGNPVAAVTNDGVGGGTQVDSPDARPGWPAIAEFLAGCRYRGAPVSQQRLLDALADEYYLSGAVVETRTHGATLIRLVDDAGYTRALRPMSPPPRGWQALQDLGRDLARESYPSAGAGEWQIWAGTGWAHLVNVGSHTDNEVTAAPVPPATPPGRGCGTT